VSCGRGTLHIQEDIVALQLEEVGSSPLTPLPAGRGEPDGKGKVEFHSGRVTSIVTDL
jgi:hypothetical protein